MSEMQMSKQEAVDLLTKWMQEKRVIHFNLKAPSSLAKVVGRIDHITSTTVYFSATQSAYSLGKYNLAEFSLDGCEFEYSDAKDAPQWLAAKLLGYDALLYVYYLNATAVLSGAVGLAVLPADEWTQF